VLLSLLLAAVPIYERVEPVEVRTGVMRLRTVEAPLLEVLPLCFPRRAYRRR
jgi:hypothetical protein